MGEAGKTLTVSSPGFSSRGHASLHNDVTVSPDNDVMVIYGEFTGVPVTWSRITGQ